VSVLRGKTGKIQFVVDQPGERILEIAWNYMLAKGHRDHLLLIEVAIIAAVHELFSRDFTT